MYVWCALNYYTYLLMRWFDCITERFSFLAQFQSHNFHIRQGTNWCKCDANELRHLFRIIGPQIGYVVSTFRNTDSKLAHHRKVCPTNSKLSRFALQSKGVNPWLAKGRAEYLNKSYSVARANVPILSIKKSHQAEKRRKCQKICRLLATKSVFVRRKVRRICFRLGLTPDPAEKRLRRSPTPTSRMVRGILLPTPFDVCNILFLVPPHSIFIRRNDAILHSLHTTQLCMGILKKRRKSK